MEYDQLLEYLNTFGWYHFVILIVVGLCHSFVNFNNLNVNFMTQHVDHWCFVPELSHLPAQVQKELSIPYDPTTGSFAQCKMYDRAWNGSNITVDTELPLVSCQHGWAYEDVNGRTTVQMTWDLVCEDAWISDLFSPLFVLGCFAGSLMAGNLCTKLGRKKCFLLLITCMMLCGISAALSVNVAMFLISRTLLAVFLIGIISVGYIIVSEHTPPAARDAAGLAYMLFYPLGAMTVGGIGHFVPDWRHLQMCCALVCAPAILVFMWIVPESSRWLAFNGLREEAAAVLSKIAAHNGHPIPTAEIQDFILPKRPRSDSGKSIKSASGPIAEATAKDLLTNSTVRLFFIAIAFSWTSSVFMFSGVSYNLDGLFSDTSITLLVCGVLEIAFLILSFVLLRRVGRKMPVFLFFGISAFGSLAAVFALSFEAPNIIVSIISLLCRSSGAGISMVMMFMSVELFPTAIRNIAIGYASAVCYIFTSAAPVVCGSMTEYWEPIPFAVFFVTSLMSIVLVTQLPETRNMPCPETIPAMEALRRSGGFNCSFMCSDPNALTKKNLVYIAESTIAENLAGQAIVPKELQMIQETIMTQRQRSLRKIPSVAYKPVFIVVPEGTSLAAVDNFVLQEVEQAFTNGESLEGRSFAHSRVYDLESFRHLSQRETLQTTTVPVTPVMSSSPPRDIPKSKPRDRSPPPKYGDVVSEEDIEKMSHSLPHPDKNYDPETASMASSFRSSIRSSMRSHALQRCNSIDSRRSYVNAVFEDEHNQLNVSCDFHRRNSSDCSSISTIIDPPAYVSVSSLPTLIPTHQESPAPVHALPVIPEDRSLPLETPVLPTIHLESMGLAQGIVNQSYGPSSTAEDAQSLSFTNPLSGIDAVEFTPSVPSVSFAAEVPLPEYTHNEDVPEVVLSIPEVIIPATEVAQAIPQPLHQLMLEDFVAGSEPDRFFMRF